MFAVLCYVVACDGVEGSGAWAEGVVVGALLSLSLSRARLVAPRLFVSASFCCCRSAIGWWCGRARWGLVGVGGRRCYATAALYGT